MKTLAQEKYLRNFRRDLLRWYGNNRRNLPWRRTRDPYAIWLSEIMLQQTTVETVIPYYEKFLARFPTLESVAKAPESELLRFWAGLGYYNRIRNFQRAARIVVSDHGGRVPEESDQLRKLPGIGSYTASAIASIAFSKPAAVVDGNVIRVLSRLFAYRKNISTTTAKAFFQSKADFLFDRSQPGDFNQAMMELGATICLPTRPQCPHCPVRSWCLGKQQGIIEKLPVKTKNRDGFKRSYACLIIRREGKILLRARANEQVLRNMWELPLVPLSKRNPPSDMVRPGSPCPLRAITHTIMNVRMKIFPTESHHPGGKKINGETRWVSPGNFKKMPLTTITRKVLESRGMTV